MVPAGALVYLNLGTSRGGSAVEAHGRRDRASCRSRDRSATRSSRTLTSSALGRLTLDRDVEPWLGDEAAYAELPGRGQRLLLFRVRDQRRALRSIEGAAGGAATTDLQGQASPSRRRWQRGGVRGRLGADRRAGRGAREHRPAHQPHRLARQRHHLLRPGRRPADGPRGQRLALADLAEDAPRGPGGDASGRGARARPPGGGCRLRRRRQAHAPRVPRPSRAGPGRRPGLRR